MLGALGYSVEVIAPAHGLSSRGTSDDKLFSGDVVRKLLVQMEAQADLSQPTPRPPQRPSGAVKVRERASRRAVKQAVDAAEAEARPQQVAAQLVGSRVKRDNGVSVMYPEELDSAKSSVTLQRTDRHGILG